MFKMEGQEKKNVGTYACLLVGLYWLKGGKYVKNYVFTWGTGLDVQWKTYRMGRKIVGMFSQTQSRY